MPYMPYAVQEPSLMMHHWRDAPKAAGAEGVQAGGVLHNAAFVHARVITVWK